LRLVTDPVEAARAAELRYVTDDEPGISRKRSKTGFKYVDPSGKTVRDERTLARIRALALPPAWTDVWICPKENGHLQATGRDAKGRKQYRYHPRWREVRDETKYGRMLAFAEALPAIRRRVMADLALPGLPKAKIVATIVKLLEKTRVRVGNREYARTNGSFGLTTLRDHHATVRGSRLTLSFRGKSGVSHRVELTDRRLARIVRQCRDIPGYELFQYVDDDGQRCAVDSGDVNEYLRESAGADFTAKDFRTWAGTVLAAAALRETPAFTTEAEARRNICRAVERVAVALGNTPTVCRKCYVHPEVIEAYLEGVAIPEGDDEAAVVALLESRRRRARLRAA
jgi:DNA topoisomerase-1